MLEIRNVTKVYRSKTGEEVKALDNVSISFPETGMVFILGKSGSGKSTLLNVMGGLDSYDSGEFIIKGKSSNDFAGSDFDAYRNTFIGFIFQEYNVLDDFSVGANIGLALELQGKKATDEAINGILAQVDLLKFAKRKPNELSGGQKQRVAIARALVKDPQIIMADEPTGALDSNTGKQIFDALKELSKTKLVLIVSHDRDFAERYADRIVELADGRIIEDVTKHEHSAERISDGVHRINDHILRIESGYRLTAADLDMINAYLARNNGDVLLSGDGRVNEELRSAAGISKDGASTVFEGTTDGDIKTKTYDKSDAKFIRSRLPMKNAVKMGSSGLKHKKFRLFMTILLSFISFAMFGLSSAMAAYEKISAATDSIIDSQIKSAAIALGVRYTEYYTPSDGENRVYTSYQEAALNDADVTWLRENTGLDFVPVFTGYASGRYGETGFNISSLLASYSSNDVYNGSLAGLTTITTEQLAVTGHTLIGRLPAAEGEIAITEFMYRQFNQYGFTNVMHDESVEKGQLTMRGDGSANDIIGKHITLSQVGWATLNGNERPSFEIVGVIDTKFDYNRYASLMPQDETQPHGATQEQGLLDMFLQQEVRYERDFGFHALGFTVSEDIRKLTPYMSQNGGYRAFGNYMDAGDKYLRLIALREAEIEGDQPDHLFELYRVATLEDLKSSAITWFEPGKSTLAANEILIPARFLDNLTNQNAAVSFDKAAFEQLALSVYGNDVWNHPSILAVEAKEFCSYAMRLEYAEQILFIKEKTATMSDSDRSENFGVTDTAAVENAWIEKWIQNRDGSGVKYGDEWLIVYDFNWQYKFYGRTSVQNYVAELYGITLPTHINTDCVQQALSFLHSFAPGEKGEQGYETSRGNMSWIERMYHYSDAIEHKVWEDTSLEAQLLKDQYNGFKNSDWEKFTPEEKKDFLIDYYCGWSNSLKEKIRTHTEAELESLRTKAFMKICGLTEAHLFDRVRFELTEINNSGEGTPLETPAYKVVGVFDDSSISSGDAGMTVISSDIFTYYTTWREQNLDKDSFEAQWRQEYAEHEDGIWAFTIAAVNADDREAIQKLVELSYAATEEGGPDLLFELQNAVMYTLGNFNDIIETLAQVFVWVGLGLAVFSSFLLMNFISTSISYKKREIGILRAVGARSSDVFKIFFSEAFIIAMINFVLAVAASLTTVIVLNTYMRNQGINITLLSFGPLQVLIMLGVSILVAAIASFLPVYRIAHKKPVDAIKDR